MTCSCSISGITFCAGYVFVLIIISIAVEVEGLRSKCDHTPLKTKVLTPSDAEHTFHLSIDTKPQKNTYLADQTYVVTLSSSNPKRPFKQFYITAEDPEVDNALNDESLFNVNVGILKPLKGSSRNSEKCYKTIEEADYSDKTEVEVHWISPKSDRPSVRLRAMVAENEEDWFTGENLTLIVVKNDVRPIDSPPVDPVAICNLTSEARYAVTFTGHWSRLIHPYRYPKVPDTNGYSDMIGASHDYNFNMWKPDTNASPGLKLLAETGDITLIERDIITNISETNGVRTLIKGRGHMHPYMAEPSYALFRVEKVHHLFSLAVALLPSPDWFLGTSMFELCTNTGWLETYEIPLYPWDAGTANGISYESEKSVTMPVDNVQRVQVGSFDEMSPFYQMNLNDLKPFAYLKIEKLDEYHFEEENQPDNIYYSPNEYEKVSELKINYMEQDEPREVVDECNAREWGDWSPCEAIYGVCGDGFRTRKQIVSNYDMSNFNGGETQNCNEPVLTDTENCDIECQ